MNLFRTKPIHAVNDGEKKLEKSLSLIDLVLFGVAAIIGAGIFSTIGKATYEGGVGISYLIIFICIACLFCAFCYAAFASRVPNAGSAYSYIYATLGEFPAWIIGWALILEYSFSNSVLSIAWSSYFGNVLSGVGIYFPIWLQTNYFSASTEVFNQCPRIFGVPIVLNLVAFLFNAVMTYIAYIGIKEAKWTAHITVIIKLITIAVVIGIDIFYVKPAHWHPVFPNGVSGVFAGISAIFFAFVGFDALSTTAEECYNPKRDLPRAMILSLLICAVVYIILTMVITGVVHYTNLNVADPIAYIFEYIHFDKLSYIISVSALFVITSAFIVFQVAQPRIWLSMGRDGLLPKKFATIHHQYHTPSFGTICTGLMVGIPATFFDINIVADLTSIGTLFAFICVCIGVLFLKQNSNNEKAFNVKYINSRYLIPIAFLLFNLFFRAHLWQPTIYANLFIFNIIFFITTLICMIKKTSFIPIAGSLCCFFLITQLGLLNWLAFLLWLFIGLGVYIFYGRKNSKLNVK